MKKTLLVLALFFCANCAMAQKSNRSITLSYGYLENTWSPTPLRGSAAGTPSGGTLLVDANLWNLSRSATLGLYAGIAKSSYLELTDPFDPSAGGLKHSTVSVRYGIRPQLHLLPLMGKECEKWDLSLAGTLGSSWCYGSTLQTEYGAGVSAAFYPLKGFGVSAEILWGKYFFGDNASIHLYESHFMMKIGLSYQL